MFGILSDSHSVSRTQQLLWAAAVVGVTVVLFVSLYMGALMLW